MYFPIKSNIIFHHIWYGNLQLLTGNQLRWLTFNFNNWICVFTFLLYQIKSQTLLMIFWSYLNVILTRHLHTCCDPDTKYLIRAKVCVHVWQGISSAEGAGVAQSDGGVNGKRKGVGGGSGTGSLFEVMKQINEPKTDFDGERDQLTDSSAKPR